MRLLAPDAYAHVFEPLRGKRIGYVRPTGNVGDRMIEWAAFQLLDVFGIDWKLQDPDGPADVDELVFAGGGSMGRLYDQNWRLRGRCLELGRPMTILPQSFTSPEGRRYKQVYVRERGSLRYAPEGMLAPDLALALDYHTRVVPRRRLGIFLRKDCERAFRPRWLSRDPAKVCKTPRQYLDLAAQYEHVVTDRLHFAISGLIVGRRVTLLPNSYHKNASMYETWLADLGCRFAASVQAALSTGKGNSPRRGRKDRRGNRPTEAA
jgi:exopolysaccharide biosynthesis predicted pyruvyltransferase EpsI